METKELSIVYGGNSLTNSEAINLLYTVQQQRKFYEAAEREIRDILIKAMEAENIIEIKNDDYVIRYIAATEAERFDTKAFRADHADVYDEYVKFSPVKSQIKIRPNTATA